MSNNQSKVRYLLIGGALICAFMGGYFLNSSGSIFLGKSLGIDSDSSSFKLKKEQYMGNSFSPLLEANSLLEDRYLYQEKIERKKLAWGAAKGLIKSLNDPYTVFMDPTETQEFQKDLNGELEGIGAELTVKEQLLTVVSPLKGSPAEKAGIKPGDIIYQVNGDMTSEMTIFEAVSKIRGKKGTKVKLTILRDGEKAPIEIRVIRSKIEIKSVTYEKKDNDIFYISLNQFGDKTLAEFQTAIEDVILAKPEGIILDLRNNGGGYLDIAVEILSELEGEKKKAVTIKRRLKEDNQHLYLNGNGRLKDIPLVVLVNKGSASASEIVAGAIQDYKRGIIIGEQSFGKGSVQEVEMLQDGSSLRMTIAKWLTPNGKTIEGVGITPDQIVKLTEKDFEEDKDPQLKAALTYLTNL